MLLDEREGEGKSAQRDDRVVYNTRIFLNRWNEVPLKEIQAKHLPAKLVRVAEETAFIDHTIILERRQAMAGVENALLGMKVGGFRKVSVSPHLA